MTNQKFQKARNQFLKKLKQEVRLSRGDITYVKKHLDKLWEHVAVTNDRLQDLEIQVNLLSRLMTVLAVEKLRMRIPALRRLMRRIEKEAMKDSQVKDLEQLYRLDSRVLLKKRNVKSS